MADTVPGDGLLRAVSALRALVENPERLDRARERFNEFLPPYGSHQSHNSALFQILNAPSKQQVLREKREWQLRSEHEASLPSNQFETQVFNERNRIIEASENRICRVPVRVPYMDIAEEHVKKRWIEQGIWTEKLSKGGVECWKHEVPLELESESETDDEAFEKIPLFHPLRLQPKPRRPKSTEELQRIAERRALREREREASRPFYQFIYQISAEREWIHAILNHPRHFFEYDWEDTPFQMAEDRRSQIDSYVQRGITSTPIDVNTMAYETVKNIWVKTGIWNQKWGILPGMSWKHEQPLEEMLREEMGQNTASVQATALKSARHVTGEAPARSISGCLFSTEPNHEASNMLNMAQQGPPAATISGPSDSNDNNSEGTPLRQTLGRPLSPAEPIHDPVSNGLTLCSQEPHPVIDPSKLPNGDTNHSSVGHNLPLYHEVSREGPRSPPQRTRRGGKKEPSVGDRRLPQREPNELGAGHSSKVSKARRKNGLGLRHRPKVSELLSNAQETLPGPDGPAASTSASAVPPRRSKRMLERGRKRATSTGITDSPIIVL